MSSTIIILLSFLGKYLNEQWKNYPQDRQNTISEASLNLCHGLRRTLGCWPWKPIDLKPKELVRLQYMSVFDLKPTDFDS